MSHDDVFYGGARYVLSLRNATSFLIRAQKLQTMHIIPYMIVVSFTICSGRLGLLLEISLWALLVERADRVEELVELSGMFGVTDCYA